MRNWDNSDELGSNNCPITQDLIDMKEVCKVLKISSHEVSYFDISLLFNFFYFCFYFYFFFIF